MYTMCQALVRIMYCVISIMLSGTSQSMYYMLSILQISYFAYYVLHNVCMYVCMYESVYAYTRNALYILFVKCFTLYCLHSSCYATCYILRHLHVYCIYACMYYIIKTKYSILFSYKMAIPCIFLFIFCMLQLINSVL